MAGVSELFKKAKTCIIESKDVLDSKTATEDKGISITKLGNIFSVSDSDDINNRIILFVNNRFQITKMRIFRNDSPSKVQSAIPVPE